jgi:SAM-dependent methyltransferase
MSIRLPNPRAPLPAVVLLARPPVRLVLTSATLLFVELLLIRWIPANVKYVGFFSNFLLMASFLGIGVGILLGRRSPRLLLSPFAPLLLGTVALVYSAQLNVQARDSGEILFGLQESTSADVNFLVLPLIVVLVTSLMAVLALPLGPLLRSMPPLRAYAFDIGGSMVGIAGFTLLSYLGTGPTAWFVVVGVLLLLMALGVGVTPWSAVGGVAMLLVIAWSFGVGQASLDTWSPYYRISAYGPALERASANPADGLPPKFLAVDGIPHQEILASDEAAASPLHRQVYDWFPGRTFERVLIIGAGSGSDTALALARGARHVDAVEIDPALARIGRDFHPEGVYADPRVTVHVNDGRAFLNATEARYDLVIYALTDSLTLVSSTAGVRLESFLFTEESLAQARDHLAADGVFVMYNIYREPWLVTKLGTMMSGAFGHEPLVRLIGPAEAVLAAGPGVAGLGTPPAGATDPLPVVDGPPPVAATDDWPFLYLRTPGVAPYYLAALAFVLGFALLAVLGAARASGTSVRRFSPHFFVLGVAFLLLETKSLVSFSLLFGTTWLVNALVFFAILASVLLAIFVNARFRFRDARPLYLALGASIAVAYLLPVDALLVEPAELRYAIAAAVAFAPVFFANLVFTYSFRDTRSADMAFASNLLGAMIGGALEYVALVTGFRALLLLVAVLYGLAFALVRVWPMLADRELVLEEAAAEEGPASVAAAT